MGWYLSEGSLGSKHVVQISQKKYVDQIEDVLKKLPFEYTFKNDCFRICSVQLAAYLHKYGLCSDKYIPDYIKNTKPEYIRLFLDAFNLGDGSIHKGNKIYFSTSKDLIDGIQELLLRVGSLGNITKQNKKGTICKIKEKEYVRNHDIYVLTENNQHLNYWFETGARKSLYINEVDYKGIVYCATVPNGTLYVRRNGKAT
jgi:intein/homing endonuclease